MSKEAIYTEIENLLISCADIAHENEVPLIACFKNDEGTKTRMCASNMDALEFIAAVAHSIVNASEGAKNAANVADTITRVLYDVIQPVLTAKRKAERDAPSGN